MAALNEEQTMIRDQAKSWITEQAPVSQFRKMRDARVANSFVPTTWTAMVEMGWTGIIIPEEFGGSDLGYLTFGIVLEELGRQLTASPLFASALAGASAVLLGGSMAQKQAVLPRIVDGTAILSLAVDDGPRHGPENTSLQATISDSGYSLTGKKTLVLEGMVATHLVVSARTSGNVGDRDGITMFLLPADTKGISRSVMHTMDSRGYAQVSFDNVMVTMDSLLGGVGQGFAILDGTLDRARAGLCAEMLGTGSQAFDMTLDYLKTREQFGKVIGSFQALGHRAAELYSAKELARSCAEAALQAIDNEADNVAERSSLAKAQVGEFLHRMSSQLIQIHGGIGMTDEFNAGLYLKRARVLETAYGNQAFHRDRYARLLGY